MKVTDSSSAYLSAVLTAKNRRRRSAKIHRLVAEAFIPNPQGLKEVNHIDGNGKNNNVQNLEWCSRKYNANDMKRRSPHYTAGIVRHTHEVRAKKVLQYSLDGNLVAAYDNAKLASEATGVCHRNILQVCRKEKYRKQAGGYKWSYESEVMTDAS